MPRPKGKPDLPFPNCARAVAVIGLASLLLAACGSSSSGSSNARGTVSLANPLSSGGYKSPASESLSCAKRGGRLNVLDESDFEHLDPGIAYYSQDYTVVYATQSPLYMFKPNTETDPSPLMAAGEPEVSDGGKTLTIHLREGVRFSPPVDREVTAADVAYAIERGANPNVANPYFHSYFESVEGAPTADGGPIKGIETPNGHEIVFHLTEPKAAIVADALSLPLSAPVPKEYAAKFDRNKPSDYADYEVATGPYMLKNNAEGRVLGIGYVPGGSATLVRNPNWSPSSDPVRPACLNEIDIKIGGVSAVLGRQTLEGTGVVLNTPPAQTTVREAAEKYPEQLEISPGAGSHYIGVNNKLGPFKSIDLRKALWAALDRVAMVRARGGELVSNVGTHFLYPGIPGYEQAGGAAGPKLDFDEHPEGDMAIAEKYMKLAGYPSGKYTGGETVTIVGARGSPAEQDAEIVNSTIKSLGFATKFTLDEDATMYAKYCNVPKEEVTVCPSVGWVADFADPQAVLDITFSGRHIDETGNSNWGQTNVPKINDAIAAAELIVSREARAKAFAKIDEEICEDAAAIPFDWDKEPNVEGKGVNGVGALWDQGEWEYSWTSLK